MCARRSTRILPTKRTSATSVSPGCSGSLTGRRPRRSPGPRDKVITTPFSFFATASCIVRLGATPVFCDIDPRTFDLDPGSVRRYLETSYTPAVKAIIPVHLYGQCCDMDPLLELARTYSLKVVEDCAQSFGSTCKGHQSGSMGDIGCFSFFPTKNLGG